MLQYYIIDTDFISTISTLRFLERSPLPGAGRPWRHPDWHGTSCGGLLKDVQDPCSDLTSRWGFHEGIQLVYWV